MAKQHQKNKIRATIEKNRQAKICHFWEWTTELPAASEISVQQRVHRFDML